MLGVFDNITKKLETVGELLAVGEIIRLSGAEVKSQDAILTTIFDTDECLVGYGKYEKAGDATPFHCHEGLTQYLLQYKGKCAVDFENAYRIVGIGECVRLGPNELHKVIALTDGAEQLFVCIPAEKGYKINRDQLKYEQTEETSMSDITKEELLAMMEVQSKTASAMENIANSIRLVSEQNKELVKTQTDIVKAFSEEREKCTAYICATLKKGIEDAASSAGISKSTIEKIRDDTFWLKVILGSAVLITGIALVLTHLAGHNG